MKFSTINIITPHVFNDFSPNHIKSDNSLALERFSGLPPKLVGSYANMQTWLCNPGPGKMILAHLCYI